MSRQKLGQHFLSQISWRTRIAETLPVERDAVWLEIGAGHGEMTELLATRARRVIAIETDAALASALRERAAHWPANATGSAATTDHAVEIIHADVLSLDIAALVRSPTTNDLRQGTASAVPKRTIRTGALAPEAGPEASDPAHQLDSTGTRFRVYGNLPYYITSPILTHLFRFADHIDSIHIVTQLEVAQRIAAHPRTRDYGYLSTLCQFYARPELVFRIPPAAFNPPPKVTSALIEMNLPGERATLGIRDEPSFLKFLQLCFAHKRKTLRNNLRGTYAHDAVAKSLAASALTENSRAEELTLHQFAQIFTSLAA
ncbi:MAG: rRNA adenine dimethyltransferase family protein [Candidatus Acidiferrales bacterium]